MDTRMRRPVAIRSSFLAVWVATAVWIGLGLWAFAAAVPVALETAGFGANTTTVTVTTCTTIDRRETVEIRCATTTGLTVLGVPRPHHNGDRITVASRDGQVHARSFGRLGMNLVGMVALLVVVLLPPADLLGSGRLNRGSGRFERGSGRFGGGSGRFDLSAVGEALGRTAATMVGIALVGIVVVTVMSLLD